MYGKETPKKWRCALETEDGPVEVPWSRQVNPGDASGLKVGVDGEPQWKGFPQVNLLRGVARRRGIDRALERSSAVLEAAQNLFWRSW